MDNAYVDGLRQHDNRPRSPVVVPHDMSALRKKILFENTLLEERTLHEFSAGKGDGAGVDTGSAPLKPLTSPTPSPTTTPTPTPTPAPAGIPVASTASVTVAGFTGGNTSLNGAYTKTTSFGGDPSITTPPTTGEFYGKGYYQLIPPNVGIGGENDWYDGPTPYFEGAQGLWRIVEIYDNSEGETLIITKASSASSNNDYIPTAGWSPSITITAA